MKRLIWTAVILLSPVFCSSALACVCVHIPDQTPEDVKRERMSAFDRAAVVFTGEAVREHDGKVTFKVDRMWKGKSVDEIVMTNYTMKTLADGSVIVYLNTTCERSFNVGDKFLIYASSYRKGILKATTCGRTTNFKHTKLYEQEIEGLNEIKQPEVRNKEPKQQEQE